ncbi:MAG: hypothetical protein GY910_03665 [bacterium]|nr:hypothetical protein [Deltaproteobacteria bacterium]MCP4904056.1 hypothetical protein [bacterium]
MKDGDSRQATEIAVFSRLEQGLAELSLPSSQKQLEQLTELVGILGHWAGRINLTGHRDPMEMTSRLVLDAAALAASLPELSSSTSLADLGSGAGFPGLPIAILYPDLSVTLVESRLKRNHFQRAARRRLGIENVSSILGRSDEVEQTPCDIVVAQAMTQPRRAFELMAEWSHSASILALPASEAAISPKAPDGFEEMTLREYVVPGIGSARRLWIARASGK